MSFSDEDLAALKERFKINRYSVGFKTVMDLIERLEAAELCASYLEAIPEKDRSPMENEALITWQKAAGKE